MRRVIQTESESYFGEIFRGCSRVESPIFWRTVERLQLNRGLRSWQRMGRINYGWMGSLMDRGPNKPGQPHSTLRAMHHSMLS